MSSPIKQYTFGNWQKNPLSPTDGNFFNTNLDKYSNLFGGRKDTFSNATLGAKGMWDPTTGMLGTATGTATEVAKKGGWGGMSESGQMGMIGGIGGIVSGLVGRGRRRSEQTQAETEYNTMRTAYQNLDTSNIYADVRNQYANLENTFEDLTINQQQAQFEAQQGAQQRANIMQNLQGAAGGSGIAGLAQAMANQGQLATQRASASIGQQEATQQRLMAQQAGRIQMAERGGEAQAEQMRLAGAESARGLEWQKTGTLLGMAQQRKGMADQAIADANAAVWGGVGQVAGSVLTGGIF